MDDGDAGKDEEGEEEAEEESEEELDPNQTEFPCPGCLRIFPERWRLTRHRRESCSGIPGKRKDGRNMPWLQMSTVGAHLEGKLNEEGNIEAK